MSHREYPLNSSIILGEQSSRFLYAHFTLCPPIRQESNSFIASMDCLILVLCSCDMIRQPKNTTNLRKIQETPDSPYTVEFTTHKNRLKQVFDMLRSNLWLGKSLHRIELSGFAGIELKPLQEKSQATDMPKRRSLQHR